MSMISWVMTSNTTANIPAPLRSRLRLVQCAQLTRNDIETFIRQQARSRALSDISADVACEVMQRIKVPSLRDAMRALDRARTLETRPILH
jgi:replication-associated recombination protein RarA